MCSKEPMGVGSWVMETIGLAAVKVGELWALFDNKGKKQDFSSGDLSHTVKSFIGLSKQFANPICPEGAASVGTPIPPVPPPATPETPVNPATPVTPETPVPRAPVAPPEQPNPESPPQ